MLRGNRRGSLRFHFGQTFDGFMQSALGRLSGGFNLGIIGGKAIVDYLHRVSESALSTSLTFSFQSEMGSVVLDERRLSPAGELAAALDAEARREKCGTHFVHEVRVGARLLASLVFHFTREQERRRFVKTVKKKALFGLIEKSRTTVDEEGSFAETAFLEVQAFQEGGHPERLEATLSDNATPICRLDKAAPCIDRFARVLQYARKDFPSQFDRPYSLDTLAPLFEKTVSYRDSAHLSLSSPSPPSTREVEEIMHEISRQISVQMALRERVVALLRLALPPHKRNQLEGAQLALNSNLNNLNRASFTCRAQRSVAACQRAQQTELDSRTLVTTADLSL